MSLISPSEPQTLNLKRAHTRYKNANGNPVPSVTTVLGIMNKPALLHWAWDQGMQGLDFRATSGEACDIGTVAHFMCECYVKGLTWDLSGFPDEVIRKAETAFLKFVSWWDKKGYKLDSSELRLVSENWQVGGTIDLVAIAPNGDRHLLDLKTSKGIYREYRIQVSAYAEIYEECTDNAIDELWIVRIGKEDEGDFETRQVQDRPQCEAAFEALREAYRLLKAVKE